MVRFETAGPVDQTGFWDQHSSGFSIRFGLVLTPVPLHNKPWTEMTNQNFSSEFLFNGH
jgi:hypothetical protein